MLVLFVRLLFYLLLFFYSFHLSKFSLGRGPYANAAFFSKLLPFKLEMNTIAGYVA